MMSHRDAAIAIGHDLLCADGRLSGNDDWDDVTEAVRYLTSALPDLPTPIDVAALLRRDPATIRPVLLRLAKARVVQVCVRDGVSRWSCKADPGEPVVRKKRGKHAVGVSGDDPAPTLRVMRGLAATSDTPGQVRVSGRTIAATTGASHETVRRHIDVLIRRGDVRVAVAGSRGRTAVYEVTGCA